jgi:hypothetical protein
MLLALRKVAPQLSHRLSGQADQPVDPKKLRPDQSSIVVVPRGSAQAIQRDFGSVLNTQNPFVPVISRYFPANPPIPQRLIKPNINRYPNIYAGYVYPQTYVQQTQRSTGATRSSIQVHVDFSVRKIASVPAMRWNGLLMGLPLVVTSRKLSPPSKGQSEAIDASQTLALTVDKILQVEEGALSVTGTAASLLKGYVARVSSGSFVWTGASSALRRTYVSASSSSLYSLNGTAAVLKFGHKTLASSGVYLISGQNSNLAHLYVASALGDSCVITGSNLNLLRSRIFGVLPEILGITGGTGILTKGYTLLTGANPFEIDGFDIIFLRDRVLKGDSGPYDIKGSGILSYGRHLFAGTDEFIINEGELVFFRGYAIVAGEGRFGCDSHGVRLLWSPPYNVRMVHLLHNLTINRQDYF